MIILYFHPLWFSRQEWAVAPSIFNIKARGLIDTLPSLDEIDELRQNKRTGSILF